MSENNKMDEKDDFWSLEKLVPRKNPKPPFASRTVISNFVSNDADMDNTRAPEERKLTAAPTPGEVVEYKPNHPLIKNVKITRRVDKYDFYGNFRKAAISYFGYKTPKCPFAEFYSYMPQYSQLSPTQRSYYFYWRAELYRGNYIKSDYSYIYLFVYEILNLPDLIPPKDGLELLLNVWCEYRKALPRIDLYFSIWVQDYCLVHKLDLPTCRISSFIFEVVSVSSFGEFYLSDIDNAGEGGFNTLLAYLSDYDYRRAKYVDGNPDAPEEKRERQKQLYKTHMHGAMREVLKLDGGALSVSGKTKVLRRDAFPNSLCTHSVKCMLEIEYYSLRESEGMRSEITSAVRYAENKLRAILGVKSRLAVHELPERYKEILDGYFGALEERERAVRIDEVRPEYEKLYSAPKEALSHTYADEIESISWSTTARLVEGMDDDEDEPLAQAPTVELPSPTQGDTYGLVKQEIDFIADAIKGEDLSINIENSSIVDSINSAFAENFGDIVLEECGAVYKIITDYEEDVRAWLTKIQR